MYKVVLVGNSQVGKSNLLLRFTGEQFIESTVPTTGIEYASKIHESPNGEIIKTQIWDTCGQERYIAITKVFYRQAVGALLVYDITC